MKLVTALTTALLTIACQKRPEVIQNPTYGEVITATAAGFCRESARCNFFGPDMINACVAHTVHAMCGAEGTCGTEVDSLYNTLSKSCLEKVGRFADDKQCNRLLHEDFPVECSEIIKIRVD